MAGTLINFHNQRYWWLTQSEFVKLGMALMEQQGSPTGI